MQAGKILIYGYLVRPRHPGEPVETIQYRGRLDGRDDEWRCLSQGTGMTHELFTTENAGRLSIQQL